MAIYLVQHGKSQPKELDPQQGLSDKGIEEVKRIAEVAAGYGVNVSEILHSPKKRARQTAEIFASKLYPSNGIRETPGLKPLDDVAAFAETLSPDKNTMLVGHMPFMERMTGWLILGETEKRIFKIQNGGILCLDVDEQQKHWFIKWGLMPNID